MTLSNYIKHSLDLLARVGDTDLLYTAIDDEGNGYNKSVYAPEIRYLANYENEKRPEVLIPEKEDGQSDEEWADEYGFDVEDIPNFKKVILM